jgi:glycosyltransferase involved in cell wall biosynthesis
VSTSHDGVLVVVPALNEEGSVGTVVDACRTLGLDVCVVDDGSTDRTAQVAEASGAMVLRLPINLGVGGALRCGFRYAVQHGYDVAVQVDADGQHDPAAVPTLLERLRETGADMVVGSRFAAAPDRYLVGRGRRLAMRVLARRASWSVGRPITDATSGLRAIRRPLLDEFARHYPVEYLGDTVEAMVIAGRQRARIEECSITMSQRAAGEASAGVFASIWYVLRVLIAIELMRRRREELPPAMPSAEGAP